MSKKLDKLVDEICSEVEKTVGHRKYVETFLQGIDFSRVDEGIIDEDYEYASDGLEDVFYYYEESLNDDEYYEKYGDIFTDKVVKLLNELKKELSKFTESKKSARKSIKESADDNWYKLKMLNEMLDAMAEDKYNIPKLAIYDVTPHISLDEGAIRALIKYYK